MLPNRHESKRRASDPDGSKQIVTGADKAYGPRDFIVELRERTLLSDRIYRAITDLTPKGAFIGHGQTYWGHPVSAAVGREVLRLYEEGVILEKAFRYKSGYAHPGNALPL